MASDASEPKPGKLSAERLKIFEKLETPSAIQQKQISKDQVSQIFTRPMLLIDNDTGSPKCIHETLTELSKIEKTLNIVSVVGTFRTGKSFLLNKLAASGSDNSFEIGHTEKCVTKGIWAFCRQHPTQEDQVVVLLDTEGIDDPNEVKVLDSCVFILSTLLSSTLVYNTRGNLDKTSIDKFKFLATLKTSVSVAGTDKDDSILDFFFPTFILTLRDVTLTMTQTSDEFLEEKLILKRGETDSVHEFNEPRLLIRRYFKKRKCFMFEQPVERKKLKDLMTIPENEICPEFRETLYEFQNYVLSCNPKTLKCGKGVNGKMLCTLVTSYVHSISDGQSPCIHTAMKLMAEEANTRAINKAAEVYNSEMKKRLSAHNAPSEDGLANFHKDSMEAALSVLKSELVFDDEEIYEEQALSVFKQHLEKFKKVADGNSRAICNNRLRELNFRILKKKNNKAYCTPTGYDEYMADVEWIVKQFRKERKYLGTQAKEALKDFLDEKVSEEEQVYQWMLEAQEKEGNVSATTIKRMDSVTDEIDDETEEEKNDVLTKLNEAIEKKIKKDVTVIQLKGMVTIRGQYLDMLKMKMDEVERVKKELSENDPQFEALQKETDYWKELWEKATWNMPQYAGNSHNERGEPAQNKSGDPAQNERGEPVQNKIGEPAQYESGEPAQNERGEPVQNKIGESAQNESGEPAQNESGKPAQNESGEPAQNKSEEPAQNESGEPAQNEGGEPAQNERGEPDGAREETETAEVVKTSDKPEDVSCPEEPPTIVLKQDPENTLQEKQTNPSSMQDQTKPNEPPEVPQYVYVPELKPAVYTESFFKVKPNKMPSDPENIPKRFVFVKGKKKDEKDCTIL